MYFKTPFSGSSTYFFQANENKIYPTTYAFWLKISAKSLPWTLKAGPKRVLKAQQNLLPIITHLRCRRNVNFQMSLQKKVFFVNKLSTLFGQNETFSGFTHGWGKKQQHPYESLNANMGVLMDFSGLSQHKSKCVLKQRRNKKHKV